MKITLKLRNGRVKQVTSPIMQMIAHPDNLERAFKVVKTLKPYSTLRKFEIERYENLKMPRRRLAQSLLLGSFRPAARKPNVKKRHIYIPLEDMIVQHAVANYIDDFAGEIRNWDDSEDDWSWISFESDNPNQAKVHGFTSAFRSETFNIDLTSMSYNFLIQTTKRRFSDKSFLSLLSSLLIDKCFSFEDIRKSRLISLLYEMYISDIWQIVENNGGKLIFEGDFEWAVFCQNEQHARSVFFEVYYHLKEIGLNPIVDPKTRVAQDLSCGLRCREVTFIQPVPVQPRKSEESLSGVIAPGNPNITHALELIIEGLIQIYAEIINNDEDKLE